jgi:hypothetical protein
MDKEQIMQEAKEQGIIEIDAIGAAIDHNTVKLATELMKKHGPEIYRRLNERRKQQEEKK